MLPHAPRGSILALVGVLALACAEPTPDARTLEGAFERVASAIDAGDAKRLYWDLELETRYSLMSVHRYQKRIRELVATYPDEERARGVAGRWSIGANAKDPGELFAALCAEQHCLEPLRARIGAASRITPTPTGGVVQTVRGGTYRFAKGTDGRYGLVAFGENFAALKIEVARDLETVEQNAVLYREAQARDARLAPPGKER